MSRQSNPTSGASETLEEGPGVSVAAGQRAAVRSEAPRSEGLSLPARVAEFGREIRAELRQVAWPSRTEVVNSATVVIVTLVVLVAAIFGLNWLFSHAVTFLLGA